MRKFKYKKSISKKGYFKNNKDILDKILIVGVASSFIVLNLLLLFFNIFNIKEVATLVIFTIIIFILVYNSQNRY